MGKASPFPYNSIKAVDINNRLLYNGNNKLLMIEIFSGERSVIIMIKVRVKVVSN